MLSLNSDSCTETVVKFVYIPEISGRIAVLQQNTVKPHLVATSKISPIYY